MENLISSNTDLFKFIAHYFCNVPKLAAIPNLQLANAPVAQTIHLTKQGWHAQKDYTNIAAFLANFSGNIRNNRLEYLKELALEHSFLYEYRLEEWMNIPFYTAIQIGYRELLMQEIMVAKQRLIDMQKQKCYNQLISKFIARFAKRPEADLNIFQRWAGMQTVFHQQLLQELHPHLFNIKITEHGCPTIWQESIEEDSVSVCEPLSLLLEIRLITGIKQLHIWTESNQAYSVILDEWGRVGQTELDKIQLMEALNSLITIGGILLVESKASVGSHFICRALGLRNRQIEQISNAEIEVALKQAQANDNMWVKNWNTKLF